MRQSDDGFVHRKRAQNHKLSLYLGGTNMRESQRILRFESLGKRELMAADLGMELENSSLVSVLDDAPLVDKSSGLAKIATSLVNIFYQEQQAPGSTAGSVQQNIGLNNRNGSLVAVDLVTQTTTDELIKEAKDLGLTAYSSYGRLVSGWLPVTSIAKLSTLASLQFARSGSPTVLNAGSASNQSSRALGGEVASQRFGVNGSGVKIGILSDSFNARGGYANDVASGDLPNDVRILADFSGGSDEGRAMAQLIADIAPAAKLMFRTAFGGVADFANGILELAAAGSDIIVDDVLYLAEPMFQDGIIAQAVNQVVSRGVTYFSSAGNSGRDSYESTFRDSGQTLTINGTNVGRLHDFDPGNTVDTRQRVRLGVGQTTTISFQWDQPFFSAGGQGSKSDYDIYILAGNRVVASSRINNVGGDAVELLSFTNSGQFGTTQFDVMITLASGPAATRVKYVAFGGALDIVEFDTNSSTTYGQANAAGAIPIGAAFFANTPNFGNAPQLQPFSSAVGTPILFGSGGTRLLTPQIRQRLIVGTDGGNTTFFGSDIPQDTDNFPNFFGTSAAAPNVAAIAALMLDANSSLTPQGIFETLRNTAIDFNQVGFDNDSGFGLVDGLAAVQSVSNAQGSTSNTSKIDNGSFETGLAGWESIGDVRIVNSSFGVPVADGNSQALLTTVNSRSGNRNQASIENFLSLSAGRLEPIASGDATAGSAIRQTIQMKKGDTLAFNASFLTNESNSSSTFNDFTFVSISGQGRQQVFLISDTTSGGFTSSKSAGFQVVRNNSQVTIRFEADGTYVIGFGVLDSGDTQVDSALVIDSIRLLPSSVPNLTMPQISAANGAFSNRLIRFAVDGDVTVVGEMPESFQANGTSEVLTDTADNYAKNDANPQFMPAVGTLPLMSEKIVGISPISSSLATEPNVADAVDTSLFAFLLTTDEVPTSSFSTDKVPSTNSENALVRELTDTKTYSAVITGEASTCRDYENEIAESTFESTMDTKFRFDVNDNEEQILDSQSLIYSFALIGLGTSSPARPRCKKNQKRNNAAPLILNPLDRTLPAWFENFPQDEFIITNDDFENGTTVAFPDVEPCQVNSNCTGRLLESPMHSSALKKTSVTPKFDTMTIAKIDRISDETAWNTLAVEQVEDTHVNAMTIDLALLELYGS